MDEWPAFNLIYASYLDPEHVPARSALGSTGLGVGAVVEIRCDACFPE